MNQSAFEKNGQMPTLPSIEKTRILDVGQVPLSGSPEVSTDKLGTAEFNPWMGFAGNDEVYGLVRNSGDLDDDY